MSKDTEEQMFQRLRDYYAKNNKAPSCRDFPKSSSYRLRFKTWNNALVLAGVPINSERNGSYIATCANCKKEFKKIVAAKSKSGRDYCSKSCAAKYNNSHKTKGYRRSKLEIYLEERIREYFPNLHLICNDTSAIKYELDFYFPNLKLAIELNGIVHYEPIYGKTRLEKTQYNDKQKGLLCHDQRIEFCVIDISSVKYVNQSAKNKYWNIVKELLESVQLRETMLQG